MEQDILSATVPTGLDSVTEDEERDAATQVLHAIVFVTKHFSNFKIYPASFSYAGTFLQYTVHSTIHLT